MRIALVGATGQMGLELKSAIEKDAKLSLVAQVASNSTNSNSNNIDALFKNCDVVIDFSTPIATMHCLPIAAAYNIPYVLGTTGFTKLEQDTIEIHAKNTAIVQSGNMSLGVALLSILAQQAAAILNGAHFDISIAEMHHKHKKDAPSGTALLLGSHILKAAPGSAIEYSAMRGGTVVGDHQVIFAGSNERLVLSHYAQDRHIFAAGALKAALWLQGKAPGLYNMHNVLDNMHDVLAI